MALSQLCGILTLAGLVGALQVYGGQQDAFEAWAKDYGRQYARGTDEYQLRLGLFAQRSAEVKAHNANPERTWEAFEGPFADYTDAERKAMRGYNPGARHSKAAAMPTGMHAFFEDGPDVRPDGEESSDEQIRKGWVTDPPKFSEGFDWTTYRMNETGKVLTTISQVPDQGHCGSCWAVTAKSVLDMHHEKVNPTIQPPVQFSAEYIINCVPNPDLCGGEGGCKGATVELAFDYVKMYSIATKKQYNDQALICNGALEAKDCTVKSGCTWGKAPGADEQKCMPTCPHQGETQMFAAIGSLAGQLSPASTFNGGTAIGMQGFTRLLQNEGLDESTLEHPTAATFPSPGMLYSAQGTPLLQSSSTAITAGELRRALVNAGPVGISMAADTIFHYKKGVLSCDHGDEWTVDHAMVLVGYGKTKINGKKLKFWRIRNSWGKNWGDKGFMMVKHSEDCKMDHDHQKGVGCKKDGTQLLVCGSCGMFLDSAIPVMKPSTPSPSTDMKSSTVMFEQQVPHHAMVRRE